MSSDKNSYWMEGLVGFWFAVRSRVLRRRVDSFWEIALVKNDLFCRAGNCMDDDVLREASGVVRWVKDGVVNDCDCIFICGLRSARNLVKSCFVEGR